MVVARIYDDSTDVSIRLSLELTMILAVRSYGCGRIDDDFSGAIIWLSLESTVNLRVRWCCQLAVNWRYRSRQCRIEFLFEKLHTF